MKRFLSLLMAVVVVMAVLCPIFFMIAESGHECTGEDCAICCVINNCENALKLFGFISIAFISAAFLRFVFSNICEIRRKQKSSESLISLKVKLLY